MAEATPVRAGEAWCSRGKKPWPISRACNGKVTCNYGWLMLGSYNDLLDYVVGVRRQDSGFQEVLNRRKSDSLQKWSRHVTTSRFSWALTSSFGHDTTIHRTLIGIFPR